MIGIISEDIPTPVRIKIYLLDANVSSVNKYYSLYLIQIPQEVDTLYKMLQAKTTSGINT